MIKRLIFLILFIPNLAFGQADTIGLVDVADVDTCGLVAIEDINTYGLVEVEVNSCPAYYADADVTFSWDGDNGSGTKFGCKSDGTTIEGSGSLTPNTSYGESGSYGVSLDGTNSIVFATSGDAQINDEIGTVWMRVYISAAPDDGVTLFEGANNAVQDDQINTLVNVSGAGWINWTESLPYATAGTLTTGSWFNFGVSWNLSTDNLSANDGAGWDEDAETMDALSNFNEIVIGENNTTAGAPGSGKYIYIDKTVILSTYEAALPANW